MSTREKPARDHVVSVWVSPAARARLAELAADAGVPVSHYARRILYRALEPAPARPAAPGTYRSDGPPADPVRR